MATRRNILLTSAALLLAACQQPAPEAAMQLPLQPVYKILAEAPAQHLYDYYNNVEISALNAFYGESPRAAVRQILDYRKAQDDNLAHIASYRAYQKDQPALVANEQPLQEALQFDPALMEEFEQASNGALDNESLGAIRGTNAMTNATFSLQEAIGAHNQCLNCNSGGNYIDSSSFNENSGLVNVILNSGNNAVIQNATTVSITFVGANNPAQVQ